MVRDHAGEVHDRPQRPDGAERPAPRLLGLAPGVHVAERPLQVAHERDHRCGGREHGGERTATSRGVERLPSPPRDPAEDDREQGALRPCQRREAGEVVDFFPYPQSIRFGTVTAR